MGRVAILFVMCAGRPRPARAGQEAGCGQGGPPYSGTDACGTDFSLCRTGF
jgi:hypothetical protein